MGRNSLVRPSHIKTCAKFSGAYATEYINCEELTAEFLSASASLLPHWTWPPPRPPPTSLVRSRWTTVKAVGRHCRCLLRHTRTPAVGGCSQSEGSWPSWPPPSTTKPMTRAVAEAKKSPNLVRNVRIGIWFEAGKSCHSIGIVISEFYVPQYVV